MMGAGLDSLSGGGKYELGPRLGGGGMAEVVKAYVAGAEGFRRPVAIKRILAEHSANPDFARLFVREARITSGLRHPNIVDVLDFDRDAEGRLYLAMELVEGRDLQALLANGPLPLQVVIHITSEILAGLGYAHHLRGPDESGAVCELGLVHRDISPHNVLLSWEGHVKVSDFGIATAKVGSHATNWGGLKGKPTYMSPEQAQGQPLDARSDLFAVGLLLHEMLTGRPVFHGGQIAEVLARIISQPIPPPRSVDPNVPADIDAVTMRLLERDLSRRYATASEALEELLSCRDATNRGSQLLADVLAERFPGDAPPRPHAAKAARAVSEGAGPAVAAPPDSGGVSGPQHFPPPHPPQTLPYAPAEAAPRRRRRGWVIRLSAAAVLLAAGAIALWAGETGDANLGSALAADESDAGAAARGERDIPDALAAGSVASAREAIDGGIQARGDAATRADVDAGAGPADAGSEETAADAARSERPPRNRPDPAARPGAEQGTGRVRVAVTPWAKVYVGGELRGYAPVNLELPVGRHRVRIVNPDTGDDERVVVTVETDTIKEIERSW